MKFLVLRGPDDGVVVRDDASPGALLELVDDVATDHALIGPGIAVVTGESSLLRPGQPFLEIDSMVAGGRPELVRGPAAIVRIDDDAQLVDLGSDPQELERVEDHIRNGHRWWWPVTVEGRVYLSSRGGGVTKRHPSLRFAVFSDADFVGQVTKSP